MVIGLFMNIGNKQLAIKSIIYQSSSKPPDSFYGQEPSRRVVGKRKP
jgi:hypothetical protein